MHEPGALAGAGLTAVGGELEPRAHPTGPAASEGALPAELELIPGGAAYTTLEGMLSSLLERVRAEMHADTAAMLLLDEDRGVLVARAAKGIEEEVRQGVQVPLGRGFAGRVAAEAKPVVLQGVHRPNIVNPILEQKGIRSLLGVPLLVEGRVIGVMHVGTLRYRDFDQDDVRLLERAAERAAFAVHSARLDEQRAMTELLQRTMLPDALGEIPGLHLSAKYLPAGSGLKVGGDWYDVFQLADGRVVFVIGDVVGRGVIAASVMAEIRTALRAYLYEGHDVATVMSLLDELLASMGRDRSATAAIFALDIERELLTLVSAGHLPALMIDPAGTPELLSAGQGPPLGIGPWHRYTAREIEFPVGSVLLLYTDGLIERRGESIDCGFERLTAAAIETFREPRDLGFADRIFGRLGPAAAVEDDVALLAIESVALGDRLELTLEASPRILAGMRRTVGRWLTRHGVDDEARFDIIVALSEAAGNAVEHAYGLQDASFTLTCAWDGDEIRMVVTDSGSWRSAARRGSVRGRGLMIMEQLLDSVEVVNDDRGTIVTMTKRIGSPP
jgi:anti-sigma regulatory factor (Ser/Thr protein kinase)/putative methionine-R-sulfoxide reductase with GAF domain